MSFKKLDKDKKGFKKYSNYTSGSADFFGSGTPFSTFSSGLASFDEHKDITENMYTPT